MRRGGGVGFGRGVRGSGDIYAGLAAWENVQSRVTAISPCRGHGVGQCRRLPPRAGLGVLRCGATATRPLANVCVCTYVPLVVRTFAYVLRPWNFNSYWLLLMSETHAFQLVDRSTYCRTKHGHGIPFRSTFRPSLSRHKEFVSLIDCTHRVTTSARAHTR